MTVRARIFMRPKTATQSGAAHLGVWALDWHDSAREVNDPMMGWWGAGSTQAQVKLRFDSKAEAVRYAEANGIAYDIEEPPATKPIKPKVYADNFKYGRAENWTH